MASTQAVKAEQPPANASSPDAPLSTSEEQDSNDTAREPFTKAVALLCEFLKPYLPVQRESGRNVFEGAELVEHELEGKPFNYLGHIVMATELLKSWERHVEDGLKQRIESLNGVRSNSQVIARTKKASTTKQLIKATLPRQPPSQPLAHALTLPKKDRKLEKFVVVGGGMVFIHEKYLRRIELENLLYRKHLEKLELELSIKVARDIEKELLVGQRFSNVKSGRKQQNFVQSGVKTSSLHGIPPNGKPQISPKRKVQAGVSPQKGPKRQRANGAEDSYTLSMEKSETSGPGSVGPLVQGGTSFSPMNCSTQQGDVIAKSSVIVDLTLDDETGNTSDNS
ncbi:uncharacterized protein KY384_001958 [Bacidia gigantensis]|uniref:uncharacterized protein n=1 Tax=Bacidia gigantensis TaxID=2732470 RepID=UPI001D0545FC|nr:uncharacterized protein KY384_001958 [Bacidia gigantensis]KAG8533175.1 hypothetical protein KY384_001958 [Bacidia gigantensis]